MNTPEIISIIVAVIAAIISFAALLNNFRFNHPRIHFDIKRSSAKDLFKCCYAYAKFIDDTKCFGYMQVSISNLSPQPGTIAEVCIIYEGNRYYVETIGMKYVIPEFNIRLGKFFPQDPEKFWLTVPKVIPPYSAVIGYFRFLKFPGTVGDGITVTVEVTYIDTKIRCVRYPNIRFVDVTNNPEVTIHPNPDKPLSVTYDIS